MREKIVPAVFLMLVLLIGFPSSVGDFSVFADEDDDRDNDKKENKNLKVSAEESKAYKKQKEKAEEAREKAQERKEKLKEKYDREIEELKEKVKKHEDKQKEKYERELKKFEEKVNRLDKDDDDDDYVIEFSDSVEIDYSSKSGVILCHYPPGNPDNAKTLTIGAPAVRAHVYIHGDTLGECGNYIELDLEERDYKLAKKHAKLEELRYKFEEKQIELAEKFADKFDELTIKHAEIQEKRAAKLLEKVESGEYYEHFIKDEAPKREFVLTFNALDADPIGQSADIQSFSGSITLITSSSTDTRGTTQFKVEECNLTSGEDSFSCKYGKARTISTGTGVKDSLVIIATFDDAPGKRTGLKFSVSTDVDIRTLEEADSIPFTVHGPQSKITHQWFLSGLGTMSVGPVTESTEESNDT